MNQSNISPLQSGGLKALALAAGLAFSAFAAPAFASQEIILHDATMDTTYWATIAIPGGSSVTAYSNGVTFRASNVETPTTDFYLFGFCIDVFHDMFINTPLEFHYVSNQGDPGAALVTDFGGMTLTADQIDRISAITDIGFLLNRDHHGEADTSIQTAAIQAAIWEIEHPGSVALVNTGVRFSDYTSYFNQYLAVTGPSDRIYTIVDTATNPSHQGFAIGWPIEVPEPGTWALMIGGFGLAGAALRRKRALAA